MNTLRWLGSYVAAAVASTVVHAQTGEPHLPRPGAVVATQVVGDVTVLAGDQTRKLKPDERVRIGVTITTARKSLVVFELSNGSTLQVGSETEIELEEFGQEPFSGSAKMSELKEEPSISRTRLRLVRGDISGDVKKLKTQRGSAFYVTTVAGTLKVAEGSFRAMSRMTEMGIGVCTVDLPSGVAEFEPLGGSYQRVVAGKRVGFALETDRLTNTIKLSELPTAPETAKRAEIVRPTPAPKVEEPAAPAAASGKTAPPTTKRK